MWIPQQTALSMPRVSPSLTEVFSNSLKSNPPIKQKVTAGQIDQCIFLEKIKYEITGTTNT